MKTTDEHYEQDDPIWMAIASASVLGVLLTAAWGLLWLVR